MIASVCLCYEWLIRWASTVRNFGIARDCVLLYCDTPYLSVRRAWYSEHNRPVISDELKTKAARRDIPLPEYLAECLREAKANSKSKYVMANSEGEPLSYTQFKHLWQYIVTRSKKELTYVRYVNGQKVEHTVKPVLGETAVNNGKVVYSLDFQVTPRQLRHTYITNLIHAHFDPKTVQYLAGHENSKMTMDIYAKVNLQFQHGGQNNAICVHRSGSSAFFCCYFLEKA